MNDRIQNLISTRYLVETDKFYNEVIEIINSFDLETRLFESLEKGYVGVEIARGTRIRVFTIEMRNNICLLLNQKIEACGLKELAYVNVINDCLVVNVRLSKYIDLGLYPPGIPILHETFSFEEVVAAVKSTDILSERVDTLDNRVDSLEAEVMWRPGGQGQELSFEHFDSLSKAFDISAAKWNGMDK